MYTWNGMVWLAHLLYVEFTSEWARDETVHSSGSIRLEVFEPPTLHPPTIFPILIINKFNQSADLIHLLFWHDSYGALGEHLH